MENDPSKHNKTTKDHRGPQPKHPITDPKHDPFGLFVSVDSSSITTKYLDLEYDTASEDQKLDIYLPEHSSSPLPAVVYIHGGGFEMGDRKYGHIHELISGVKKGYAVASISYRLSSESPFPAAIQDIRNGIRYLRAHADEYGIDPDRIGIFGESAGGGLTALAAMNDDVPEFDCAVPDELANTRPTVAAAVDWFGVYDMENMRDKYIENLKQNAPGPKFSPDNCPESRFMGGSLSELPRQTLDLMNAIKHINPNMAPLLIEHGTSDKNVPCVQSQNLYHAIKAQLGEGHAELYLLEDAAHEDKRFESPENMALVWAFFDKYLKK